MKIKLNEALRPVRFCAIDASTNSMAFAFFDNGKLSNYGKIKFIGKNVYEKIGDASKKSRAFFNRLYPEVIVVEHTVYMNSPKTVSDLALVQGALLGGAAQSKVRLAGSINPIAWQTFLGNGKLTKEEKLKIRQQEPNKSDSWYRNYEREYRKLRTIRLTNLLYDVDNSDNDIADAIGIGHYALHNWGKIDK